MRHECKLPGMGDDGPEEATVAYWLVGVGDDVSEGDDLVELTTDKASFTVPCPQGGTVIELLVAEGDDVAVGEVLCMIESI
jgi:pyruvate/2-oxoglutarate dehydrogenase complex dihydrolipoamide acyltransferase (E2) component